MTQATMAHGAQADTTAYNTGVIKSFVVAAMFWGVVGFLAGDFIAWQLAFPFLNLDLEWTTFGRMRPVHTSAVIFAFGGNIPPCGVATEPVTPFSGAIRFSS